MVSNRTVIRGRHVFTGRPIEIEMRNGRIAALTAIDVPDSHTKLPWVAPGLVDLQVNGHAGLDFNAEPISVSNMLELCQALLREGVTAFLPTVITAPENDMLARLEAIADARRQSPVIEKMVPCVHVEGPSIDPTDGPRGAHPVASVRPPSKDEFLRWQKASEACVGIVTISPHWPNVGDYINFVCRSGARVAIGHTNATCDEIANAVEAGATLSTHLGNGIAQTLDRHDNAIWPQLADDRLYASFIADGFHLPPAALKSFIKAKGFARSILVSDSVALCRCEPGVYQQHIGGKVELTDDGALRMSGTPYLAGAARPLQAGIATLVAFLGITMGQAWRLASSNPRHLINHEKSFVTGSSADLVLFRYQTGDRELTILQVWLEGRCVMNSRD